MMFKDFLKVVGCGTILDIYISDTKDILPLYKGTADNVPETYYNSTDFSVFASTTCEKGVIEVYFASI